MIEFSEQNLNNYKKIELTGRIDGITSNELATYLINLIEKGNRKIILDFKGVNYLSSIGLRVLLVNQQKLKSVGGELNIFGLSPQIAEIFKMSGFLKIFTVIDDIDQFVGTTEQSITNTKNVFETENISFTHINTSSQKSKIELIGDFSKLSNSEYQSTDLITISAQNTGLSIGFGAIGSEWESIKSYFGESLTINNSLIYYPAIKKPAVDFMMYSPEFSELKYGFLYNIQTKGQYSDYLSFEAKIEPIEIQNLLTQISEKLELDLFAFAIIAESKGLRGMNLKKIPIIDNQPSNKKSIFDNENFADWINFPVELSDYNSIVAGAGFYISKNKQRNAHHEIIFGKESLFHLHTAIYEKSLIGFKVDDFNDDLNKILNELNPIKVQHILTNSIFSIGNIAIIGLED